MGAAVHREMAESACAYAGWHLGESRERESTGFSGQPDFSESVPALYVRHVDAASVSCMSIRALCGRRHHPLRQRESSSSTDGHACSNGLRNAGWNSIRKRPRSCTARMPIDKAIYPDQNFDFLGYTFRPRGSDEPFWENVCQFHPGSQCEGNQGDAVRFASMEVVASRRPCIWRSSSSGFSP